MAWNKKKLKCSITQAAVKRNIVKMLTWFIYLSYCVYKLAELLFIGSPVKVNIFRLEEKGCFSFLCWSVVWYIMFGRFYRFKCIFNKSWSTLGNKVVAIWINKNCRARPGRSVTLATASSSEGTLSRALRPRWNIDHSLLPARYSPLLFPRWKWIQFRFD